MLHTCGSDRSTWLWLLRWVSEYFWQYNASRNTRSGAVGSGSYGSCVSVITVCFWHKLGQNSSFQALFLQDSCTLTLPTQNGLWELNLGPSSCETLNSLNQNECSASVCFFAVGFGNMVLPLDFCSYCSNFMIFFFFFSFSFVNFKESLWHEPKRMVAKTLGETWSEAKFEMKCNVVNMQQTVSNGVLNVLLTFYWLQTTLLNC